MERLLVEFLVRTALIAMAVGVGLWALRIRRAAAQHTAWVWVTLAMLALPAWLAWGPKASLPVLPAQPATVVDVAPMPIFETEAPVPVESVPPTRSHRDWNAVLPGVYLLGALTLLLRLAVGTIRARRLTSANCAAPVTVGLLRPRVILPQSAREWPPARLAVVLAHEREHVRRRDPLFQWLALFNRAVFWFHPLAWWIERRLAALAEEACDTAVIEQGHDPREYSLCLLELARTVEREGARVNVVAMAMPGVYLPRRIKRIVAGVRAPRLSRARLACAAAACAIPAVAFATSTLARTPQSLRLSSLPALVIPQPPELVAQVKQAPAPEKKLEFDAATIRPAAPLTGGGTPRGGPGTSDPERVNYRYLTVKNLLMTAYSMPVNQIIGPSWIDADYFDITAKVPPGATKEQVNTMLQNLLADRFKLVVHRERREMAVMVLLATKAWKGQPTSSPNDAPVVGVRGDAGSSPAQSAHFDGQNVTLAFIANYVAPHVGGVVVDQTGLTGAFDFHVTVPLDAERIADRSVPVHEVASEIVRDLIGQLGLKLESKKDPVEVLVVDSGEKVPTEN